MVGACLGASPAVLGAEEAAPTRLRILLNQEPVGTERFEIVRTPTEVQARGEVELKLGGEKLRQTADLRLGLDLSPRSYDWTMAEPRANWLRLRFDGGSGVITFPREDGKEEQQVYDFGAQRVAVVDINVFHHFLLLAQLYDFAAGGVQTFKVFVPQSVQPGEAKVELVGEETDTEDGQTEPVRQFSLTTADNQVLLWVTRSGRFLRLRVPQANVEVLPEASTP